MKSAFPLRSILVPLAAPLFLMGMSVGGGWAIAGASIFDLVLIGVVASGIAWCFPGNRSKHAKAAFDFAFVFGGFLMLSAELTRHL
jgi:hypothetical protein